MPEFNTKLDGGGLAQWQISALASTEPSGFASTELAKLILVLDKAK
jgi:hypothetical protein